MLKIKTIEDISETDKNFNFDNIVNDFIKDKKIIRISYIQGTSGFMDSSYYPLVMILYETKEADG